MKKPISMLRDVVIDGIREPVVMHAWANAKLAVFAAMTDTRVDCNDMAHTGIDAIHRLLLGVSAKDKLDSLIRIENRGSSELHELGSRILCPNGQVEPFAANRPAI
jgi:hypothetical protein